MAKLNKQYYFNSLGQRKVNCYKLNIPKKIIDQTTIGDDDNIIIKVEDDKIIISKA